MVESNKILLLIKILLFICILFGCSLKEEGEPSNKSDDQADNCDELKLDFLKQMSIRMQKHVEEVNMGRVLSINSNGDSIVKTPEITLYRQENYDELVIFTEIKSNTIYEVSLKINDSLVTNKFREIEFKTKLAYPGCLTVVESYKKNNVLHSSSNGMFLW